MKKLLLSLLLVGLAVSSIEAVRKGRKGEAKSETAQPETTEQNPAMQDETVAKLDAEIKNKVDYRNNLTKEIFALRKEKAHAEAEFARRNHVPISKK